VVFKKREHVPIERGCGEFCAMNWRVLLHARPRDVNGRGKNGQAAPSLRDEHRGSFQWKKTLSRNGSVIGGEGGVNARH